MEITLVNLYNNLPYLAAFLAGVLTFLSPCILPLIPPYMSYISGISIEELNSRSYKQKIHIFERSLLFVIGFSLVFILLGISFNTLIGRFLSNPVTNYIAGAIIIVFGIHFLGIFRLTILYKTKRFSILNDLTLNPYVRIISPFILGIGFALGWSPCVGPILASIIALNSISIHSGIYLLIVYALGLGVPFLLTALLIEQLFRMFDKVKKYYRFIEIISGILLVVIGIVIIFGGLDRLSMLFS